MVVPSNRALEILRERLAKGEISLDDFHKLSPHVQGGDSSSSTHKGPPRQAVSPTNTNLNGSASNEVLIDVAGLQIGHTFFSSNGKRHGIDEITSLRFHSDRVSINFIATTKTYLTISVQSGASYKHWTRALLITGKGNSLLRQAHQRLATKTFAQRLERHVVRMNAVGNTEINGVHISKDGWISKDRARVNIASAWRSNNVVIGTGWSFGFNGSQNPYEIIVGENGTSVLARRVRVVAYVDTDVLVHLLTHFRSNGATQY